MKIAFKPIRILKRVGIAILFFVTTLCTYALSAYTLSRMSVNAEPNTSKDISIYILTNGVHTDIVLPIKTNFIDWSEEIKFENTNSKDTAFQYVALGWGDRGFYLETPTWADLKFSTAFKAAFGLSKTAIHTTFYQELKEGKNCVKIKISANQYQKLIEYVKKSFKTDSENHFVCIQTDARYGKNDAFYEATGSYSLFHTCNTWTNNALKIAGQKACVWTPFDTGIFYHYQHN
ncbi:urease-associated protein [bacterium 336/3]|nr:urease-associated protein [bacterium 336/3]